MERSEPALLPRLRAAVSVDTGRPVDPPRGRGGAAVLLLFDASHSGLPLLFILRSEQLRFHAGQIAFPGGMSEADDSGPVETALREAHEEVGVGAEDVEVIGTLSPLLTATSDLWLTPVVGLQRSQFDVVADPFEVAEWFRLELDALLRAPHTVRDLARGDERRLVHFYEADGRTIWGVSAAILHELMTRLGRRD